MLARLVKQRQEQRLTNVHQNGCFLKVGKKLQKHFRKNTVLINLQTENGIYPCLKLPEKTKKVTKIFIFAPFCRTLKGFMKTVKEVIGRVRVNN